MLACIPFQPRPCAKCWQAPPAGRTAYTTLSKGMLGRYLPRRCGNQAQKVKGWPLGSSRCAQEVTGWEEGADSLRTSWRFSAILDLPWRPLLAAAGRTTHKFDPASGLVVEHLEEWDVEPGKVGEHGWPTGPASAVEARPCRSSGGAPLLWRCL